MPEPTNKKLYATVTAEAKKRYKVFPSAYASQWIVKEYKSRGGKYSGKKNDNTGLSRWRKEKWTDEKGNVCGAKTKENVKKCRPTVIIDEKRTPITWKELKEKGKRRSVIKEKKKTGMGKRTSSIPVKRGN